MKRLVQFAMILLCAASLSAQTARKTNSRVQTKSLAPTATLVATATSTIYTSINFTWQYLSTVPPACTSNGILQNCYSGFTITDTTMGTVLATPSTLGPSTLSFLWTPSGGLYYGTRTFSIVTNGFDGDGNPITSSPATTSVTNSVTSLNAPTGFTGTPK
jgi:hypothetical protein